jgi:hypothetical protein
MDMKITAELKNEKYRIISTLKPKCHKRAKHWKQIE